VLILLPPSEGKFGPARGKPLDLDGLSSRELSPSRRRILDALIELCSRDPDGAREVLGLPPGLAGEIDRNARLASAPTATVTRIYTGVLYDALGLESLGTAAKRRAASRVLVTSSLFGVLRPGDRIPAYRLAGDVKLPGLGTVSSVWRAALPGVLGKAAGKRLIVDLRSGTYAAFWRPAPEQARRVVAIRVLQEAGGRRTVVSHFNKATKGRIVRKILEEGSDASTPAAFADLLTALGWKVEPTPGSATSYDVVVTEVG
jgi:cytoplasmic iron level regulating protein YaaA (DUF328/UPF0246 family)